MFMLMQVKNATYEDLKPSSVRRMLRFLATEYIKGIKFLRPDGTMGATSYAALWRQGNAIAVGLDAQDIPLTVPQEEKHRRVNRLISVSQKKLTAFYHRFEGETRPVLFEDNKIGQYICGFTDNYIKVKLPYDAGLANRIIPIRLEKGLFCEDE